jgi:hypothetical protein
MYKKSYLRYLGIFFFILGAFFLLNSFSGLTGFAILENANFNYNFSTFWGLIGILLGILILFTESLEEKLSIKRFRRKAERISREKLRNKEDVERAYKTDSVRHAILMEGMPLNKALEFYDNANRNLDDKDDPWIELSRTRDADYATNKKYRYDFKTGGSIQEAAAYRFFGPRTILKDFQNKEIEERLKKQSSVKKSLRKSREQIEEEVQTEIKYIPENQAQKLFAEGYIPGKIHEIFGGYQYHGGGVEGPNYEKTPSGWKRKSFRGLIRKGEHLFTESSPLGEAYHAGAAHHRHWEIGQMYNAYITRKEKEERLKSKTGSNKN